MAHFVDRRLNPKEKSLGNRRRFLRRVRHAVKGAVDESIRRRGIADVDQAENVSVPTDGIAEPQFQHAAKGGRREHVFTGNKTFRAGDRIDKPQVAGGGGGRKGSETGESEDDFMFVLSRDEFLDIFFEDLELPDLVKRSLKEATVVKPRRAGFSVVGSPANLSVSRTMRNAHARRVALGRPSRRDTRDLLPLIEELEAIASPTSAQKAELDRLLTMLERAEERRSRIPYVDPLDVRYKYFTSYRERAANAVMFCLMDVSASMGEREKDLAKRFFILLHLFLRRRYEKIDLVFIRHTQTAKEVDEDTFFHSRETGGTVVSSALREMKAVIDARYSADDWNIYAAQASDGENFSGDSGACREVLSDELMKLCQYFAYIEIVDEGEAVLMHSEESGLELWNAYRAVAKQWPNFAMKRIAGAADIYPVFRELFAKKAEVADHG